MCRNNLVAWDLVETKSQFDGAPDELSLYVVEGYYQGESCRVRRHTLRVDGFVSVCAPLSGGEFVTKLLRFKGSRLELNFATSAAGSLRVELQDAKGEPLPGFALDDCPEIFGDTLGREVRWKGGADLSMVAGRPVRIRFEVKDADLYSFRFAD